MDEEACKSCAGCVFMYFIDRGYSNYTVEETQVYCAMDMNPKLRSDADPCPLLPYDWAAQNQSREKKWSPEKDNWEPTKEGRCMWYIYSDTQFYGDVDEEAYVANAGLPEWVAERIRTHSGRF